MLQEGAGRVSHIQTPMRARDEVQFLLQSGADREEMGHGGAEESEKGPHDRRTLREKAG